MTEEPLHAVAIRRIREQRAIPWATYPEGMGSTTGLEDQRGVDVAHIRTLLEMTPAQRLAHMLDVLQKVKGIAEHARQARR